MRPIPSPEHVQDDIPLAQLSIPSLTTITFDDSKWLAALTENILAISRGEPIRESLPKPLSIVVRTSIGTSNSTELHVNVHPSDRIMRDTTRY